MVKGTFMRDLQTRRVNSYRSGAPTRTVIDPMRCCFDLKPGKQETRAGNRRERSFSELNSMNQNHSWTSKSAAGFSGQFVALPDMGKLDGLLLHVPPKQQHYFKG